MAPPFTPSCRYVGGLWTAYSSRSGLPPNGIRTTLFGAFTRINIVNARSNPVGVWVDFWQASGSQATGMYLCGGVAPHAVLTGVARVPTQPADPDVDFEYNFVDGGWFEVWSTAPVFCEAYETRWSMISRVFESQRDHIPTSEDLNWIPKQPPQPPQPPSGRAWPPEATPPTAALAPLGVPAVVRAVGRISPTLARRVAGAKFARFADQAAGSVPRIVAEAPADWPPQPPAPDEGSRSS